MLSKLTPTHSAKDRTGIEGFDEITNGGLLRGQTTLIEGVPVGIDQI